MIDQHTLTLPLGNDDVASAKSRDKNGLITSSRNQTWQFKAATKLHFINYSHAVIVLSSAGLYKSAFSSILLVKLGFWLWFLFFQHCFDLMSSEKTYKESRYKKHTSREVCV